MRRRCITNTTSLAICEVIHLRLISVMHLAFHLVHQLGGFIVDVHLTIHHPRHCVLVSKSFSWTDVEVRGSTPLCAIAARMLDHRKLCNLGKPLPERGAEELLVIIALGEKTDHGLAQ